MASKRIKGITIEIGAETKQLTAAIKDAEKQIGDAAYKMRDINKLLKADPKNVELLTQKQKAFTEAIEGTKEKLKQEKQALEQLKNGPQTEETIRQQEALGREIAETEQKLESLEKEYKEFGSVAKQQTKAAAEEMKNAGQKIQNVGGAVTSAGRTMTTYVTAPLVAAGAASVTYAANFEESMDKVQAISGATREEMEQLEAISLKLGAETKFSASEMAEALSYMGMAGWKSEEMLAGLPGIAHLAAAANEDLATTSDIVTDALTAFGYKAEDATRFADILASAATNSNTTVSMLGESFKYAAAPAGTLGYSAEDVALALGLMANNGIKADMAGTSLRNMFQRMAKPTKESQAAIDMLGLSLYDSQGKMYSFREVMQQMRDGFGEVKMSAEDFDKAVEELDAALESGDLTQKKYDSELEDLTRRAFGAEQAEKARAAAMLGGTRAMSGLLAIVNSSDEDFDKLANAIDNSSQSFAKLADGSIVPMNEALASGQEIIAEYNGQAEAMAAIMEDNLNGDMRKMKASLEALGISMGQLMIPKLRELVDSLKDFVDSINAMDEDQKQAIINMGLFAAAIGPVLLVIGSLITGVGKLVWAIGTIKGAFAAGGALAGAGEALSGVAAGISGLLGPIALVAAAIAVWVHNWDEIKEAGQLFVERTLEHFEAIKAAAIEVHEAIKAYVAAKWEEIKNTATTAMEALKIALGLIWDFIKGIFQEKIEFIKGVVDGGFGFIVETIKGKLEAAREAVQWIIDNIKGIMEGVANIARTWGEHLIDNFVGGIKSKASLVTTMISGLANTVREYLHFSEPDVGPLADFNTWMPDMMSQMAEQINAGVPGVRSAMQNVTGAMRGEMAPDYSGQLAGINQSVQSLAAAGGGNITVPVYIGQQKFAQAVVDANQVNRFRNGGR